MPHIARTSCHDSISVRFVAFLVLLFPHSCLLLLAKFVHYVFPVAPFLAPPVCHCFFFPLMRSQTKAALLIMFLHHTLGNLAGRCSHRPAGLRLEAKANNLCFDVSLGRPGRHPKPKVLATESSSMTRDRFACLGFSVDVQCVQVAYVTSKTGATATRLKIKAAARKNQFNINRHVLRFKALWHIYSHCSRGRRTVVLPGDLQTAIKFRKLHENTFKQCPALLVASLLGKELPWYSAIQDAWSQRTSGTACRRSGVRRSGVAESAVTDREVAEILQAAARLMVGVNRKVFVQNLGRNVSHHSGWLPFLLQRRLLKKRRGRPRGSGFLHFGGEGRYTVAPITSLVLSKVRAMSATGQVLLNLPAPRTMSEWRTSLQTTTQQATKSETSRKYQWPFLVRAALISKMRVSRVGQLECPRSLTVGALRGMFPDQKAHLTRFCKPSDTVAQLRKTLAYDGPLELLTMFLCFFCSRRMGNVSPESLQQSRSKLIKQREIYYREHNMAPHCCVLGSWAQ